MPAYLINILRWVYMVPEHVKVHPEDEQAEENYVPVRGQEDYGNAQWCNE